MTLHVNRLLFIGLLVAVVFTFPPLAPAAAWQSSFATYVHAIVLEAFPWLLIGSLLAGLIEWLLPADLLPRLARRLGPWGLPAMVALAPLTPVCECGVLPVARSLLGKGLPLPHTIAFLLAAPILNPTVILTTWLAFQDWRFPLLRVVGAVLVACTVGALVWRLSPRSVLVAALVPMPAIPRLTGLARRAERALFAKTRPAQAVLVAAPVVRPAVLSVRRRLGALSSQVLDHFLDMAGYFLAGVFIAAAMKTFLGTHLDAVAGSTVLAPLAMMGTAFVLSLCAEADAFVAASFTEFDLPAKLAFLVFGPMFDIKLLLMYLQVFTARFIVLLSVVLTVLVFGYALLLGLLP